MAALLLEIESEVIAGSALWRSRQNLAMNFFCLRFSRYESYGS